MRDAELLHLGDEGNGACGVMQDSDQLKLQSILSTVAAMVEEGTVQRLTDGHTFEVFDRAGASAHLELLLDQAMSLQQVALDVVGEQRSVSPAVFVIGYLAGMTNLKVGGANPNPLFTAMMALNQMREIGLLPTEGHTDKPWQRPDLVIPTLPEANRTDSRSSRPRRK